MEPINVYSHNNNIAIVLEETETEEKGIYVNVPFSSYAPISDDNVAFTAIESFIYAFVRKKYIAGHLALQEPGPRCGPHFILTIICNL